MPTITPSSPLMGSQVTDWIVVTTVFACWVIVFACGRWSLAAELKAGRRTPELNRRLTRRRRPLLDRVRETPAEQVDKDRAQAPGSMSLSPMGKIERKAEIVAKERRELGRRFIGR